MIETDTPDGGKIAVLTYSEAAKLRRFGAEHDEIDDGEGDPTELSKAMAAACSPWHDKLAQVARGGKTKRMPLFQVVAAAPFDPVGLIRYGLEIGAIEPGCRECDWPFDGRGATLLDSYLVAASRRPYLDDAAIKAAMDILALGLYLSPAEIKSIRKRKMYSTGTPFARLCHELADASESMGAAMSAWDELDRDVKMPGDRTRTEPEAMETPATPERKSGRI